jgi:signal transduction histidine kinase/HAMP domain-containing protein
MGLRAKLALGFGGLLLVLLAISAAGLSWLGRLGSSADVILRENFSSVLAAQEMKDAMERLDSGALFALTGNAAEGRELQAANATRFEQALELEKSNITLPGEGEKAAQLEVEYRGYRQVLEAILDDARPLDERRARYYDELLPRFQRIKGLADDILGMNQDNMVEASDRARRLASRARRQMILAMVAGSVLALAGVALLGRAILVPLQRLTASAGDIERGNYELVLEPPSRDELGQLAVAFNAMARRLRDLRRTDQARLLRAQRLSQLTIDSLPDLVVLFTPEGDVELANRAAMTTLGVRAGQPAPESVRPWLTPLLAEVGRSGAVRPSDGYQRSLQLFVGGVERFYLPNAIAIHDADLGWVGVTVVLADVTELRRLDAMKSDVVSTVSHELMTPLTSLSMALHIVLEEKVGPLEPAQVELLVGARQDSERLRRILEGLLDVARLEGGGVKLDLESMEPEALLRETLEPMRPMFDDHQVTLQAAVDPATPRVRADRMRAGVALENYLTNALKHTPPGGSVRVTVDGAAEGKVRFTVADSGPGIAPEHQGRVFERFFRVPGGRDPGTGLGLAIVREVIEAQGGKVGCSSEPGAGASFWLELPAA